MNHPPRRQLDLDLRHRVVKDETAEDALLPSGDPIMVRRARCIRHLTFGFHVGLLCGGIAAAQSECQNCCRNVLVCGDNATFSRIHINLMSKSYHALSQTRCDFFYPMLKGLRLGRSFFDRSVHEVAPELIGTTLLVDRTGGTIVEVEAYDHEDPAAHGYRGRNRRNLSMFGPPGHAYVYRS